MSNQVKCLDRWLASVWLLGTAVLAVYLALPLGEGMGRARGGSSLCDQPTQIRNYLSHLEGVAPVHSVPGSGALPFAPRGVSLHRLGSGPKVGRGVIGLVLHDEAINKPRHLNWVIKAMLVKVTANGKALKTVARKSERIGTRKVSYETVTGQRFVVSGSPAYYRIDLHFEKDGGQKLGRYSEYFRVMKARYQAVMTVSDSEVVPGQMVQARIENLGTEPIQAELKVDLESYDGMQWNKVTAVYPGGRVIEGRAFVFGGETGPCLTFEAPTSAASGKFRVTGEIRRYLKDGQRRHVSAEFKVSQAR